MYFITDEPRLFSTELETVYSIAQDSMTTLLEVVVSKFGALVYNPEKESLVFPEPLFTGTRQECENFIRIMARELDAIELHPNT